MMMKSGEGCFISRLPAMHSQTDFKPLIPAISVVPNTAN